MLLSQSSAVDEEIAVHLLKHANAILATVSALCKISMRLCSVISCVLPAGYACEFKECPAVTGWFGSIGASHSNSLVCAGVGDCDYTTGTCK